ncbi:MAG: SH3 domain-containing protein, partial [Treponema sp.]|nr:SH3 domain-containing protein [Treponema sp.]
VGIIVLVFGLAFFTVANTVEKAEIDAAFKNFPGTTLTIYSQTLNLRSEPNGTSSIIKVINKDETVTATGNISGLWVPVESGSTKGYVFLPFVRLKGTDLSKDIFPFEATAAAPLEVLDRSYIGSKDIIPQGSVVTVRRVSSSINSDRIITVKTYIDFDDIKYHGLLNDEAEKLVPKLNADGSIATISK